MLFLVADNHIAVLFCAAVIQAVSVCIFIYFVVITLPLNVEKFCPFTNIIFDVIKEHNKMLLYDEVPI